jgi:hypothetical protein
MTAWLFWVFDALLGCSHRQTTFPQTPARRSQLTIDGTPRKATYVVCLDCGQEFDYNWTEMRLGSALSASAYSGSASPLPANR